MRNPRLQQSATAHIMATWGKQPLRHSTRRRRTILPPKRGQSIAKKPGLEHALLECVTFAEHKNCARYIYANWKKKYNGHYFKSLFWKAIRAMEESKLNRVLIELAATSQQTYDSLITTRLKKNCQTHVSTICKSDNVINNISETFNAYILKAKSKPIVDMLEKIKRKLMKRMYMKREMVSKWSGDICPNIRRKLEKSKEKSRYCIVTPSCNFKFEVQYMDKIYVVNFSN
ncbi:hypothetical protein Cni_G20606 [Canna indica]|uniref:Uncharacterized protein n=1 Tax=Canna indica TaxID=4628 RepID=A0AAQ3KQ82_9LILI|nr:hypothetical protein Cni_G20606 [Canna indica]